MTLTRLSIVSVLGCAIGLALVLAMGLWMNSNIRYLEEETVELRTLQQRINALSVASDSLLLFRADPELLDAVRAEAAVVQQSLSSWSDRFPVAGRARTYIQLMLDILETENLREEGSGNLGRGPLSVSPRARMIMAQIAGHGTALDTAIEGLVAERQQRVAEQTSRIVGLFFVAALLFGILCIFAFATIHRRLAGPVREFSGVIQSLATGRRETRMPVVRDDELGQLAWQFNQLLDQQQADEAALRHYEEALEESHRLLSESQAVAKLGSVRFDVPGNHLTLSTETFRIVGLDPDQWSGSPDQYLERIHPDDYPAFMQRRQTVMSGESELDVEYRIVRPDGGVRHIHHRAYPELDESGRVLYVMGTIQDVTDYKKTAETLDEQEHLLSMAGRLARFGAWSVDPEVGRVYWSDMVCDIHDMPRGTVVPLDEGIDFYAPEYRERIGRLYRNCVENGRSFDAELEILTAWGRRVWVRTSGEAVKDRYNRVVRVQGALQDITDIREAQDEAEQLGQRFRMILDNLGEAFFLLDREWCFTYVNRQSEHLLHRSADELLGRNIWELFPEAEHSEAGDVYRRCLREGGSEGLDDFYYDPLATWFDIRAYAFEGGLAVFFEDVTTRHELIRQLRDHERELAASRDELAGTLEVRQALIDSLPAHIALVDADGRIEDVNEYWRRFARENDFPHGACGMGDNYLDICDAAAGENAMEAGVIAQGLRQVLAGERASCELEYPCHSPWEERWFRVMVNRLAAGQDRGRAVGAVVMHLDITERKQAERELNRLAFEDALTGVLSRNGFVQQLDRGLHEWDEKAVVLMLDVINLRAVNDAHGYDLGDQLLQQIGHRLLAAAGDVGLVGRAGGDEFMVYLPTDMGSRAARRRAIERIFARSFQIQGVSIEVVARFGYTRLGTRRRQAEQLLREAELALYQGTARQQGQPWSAYTRKLDRETRDRTQMARELRQALENDEFELHFQPKVELETGVVVGAEALIRWHHPERGMISPALFIPVAEQSQLIGPIGDWVLEAACRALSSWQQAGLDIVRVSVNVSLEQFGLGDFAARVRETLGRNRVAPGAVSLEITESVFGSDESGLAESLGALSEMGIRLSLDDFGTGYSSLLYLQKYPFDEIKIDRGFVGGMFSDSYSREIVNIVIGVAGLIDAEVVAEGVETVGERDELLAMGCRIGQGYYFSRPLSDADFRSLLERRSPLPLKAG